MTLPYIILSEVLGYRQATNTHPIYGFDYKDLQESVDYILGIEENIPHSPNELTEIPANNLNELIDSTIDNILVTSINLLIHHTNNASHDREFETLLENLNFVHDIFKK